MEQISEYRYCELAVGCATLGLPLSSYINSQRDECIFKRKKPGFTQRKPHELDLAFHKREVRYKSEENRWKNAKAWIMEKILTYDSIRDSPVPEHEIHHRVQLWYEASCYKSFVAVEHAVPIIRHMEVLLKTNHISQPHEVIGGSRLQETAHDFANSDSRDLLEHLEVLKSLLPEYEKQCEEINKRRARSVRNAGMGADLDQLMSCSFNTEDFSNDNNSRLKLFTSDNAPEFLKSKQKVHQ